MRTNNQTKRQNLGSFFRKVGALLTGTALLASMNLTTAALANDQGGRNAAFEQFQIANPGLDNKELRQMFKQEWREIKNANNGGGGGGVEAIVNIQNQAIQNINNNSAIDRNDFASKAEWQAAKQAFKLEQKGISDTINKTVQLSVNNKFVNVNAGFALDLSSAVQSITLGDNLFKKQDSVTINIGGQEKTLSAGSKVTAAEYVAAKQAMAGGAQSVTLDADGRATGGTVDLSAMTAGNKTMKVTDLTVPVSVVASGDFGKNGDVKISGDLTNSGSINAYSSNGKVDALIRADNITNNAGASINSTVSDLTLHADDTFANYGDISATGNLTLNGGNSLTNSGNVNVAKNLNVLSPNVTNSGNLASANGNITFDTPVAAAMNINNSNGTVSALNGAINVRDAGYNAAFDSNINGGDFLSNQFNINAGGGTVNVNVDNLTGVVSGAGYGTHVTVDSADTLKLGNLDFIDPTFYNSAGNINITGDITVAEALTIIASGDITSSDNIDITAEGGSGGFPITLIAGANITSTVGGADQTSLGPIPPPNLNNGEVTIDGTIINSVSGGNVTLGTGVTINATQVTAPPANFSGADVNIVALEGTGLTNGTVSLSGVTINTGGGGTGNNGNVNIFAGGDGVKTIGAINTAGGSGTAGNVSIVMAQAVNSSPGDDIVYNANGSLATGLGFGSLVAGTSFGTGTTALSGAITAGSGSVVASVGADLDVTGSIAGNSIQITTATGSGGSIQLNDSLTGSGVGNQVVVSADGSIIGTSTVTGTTVSLTSTTGNIGTSAASRVSTNATNLDASRLPEEELELSIT